MTGTGTIRLQDLADGIKLVVFDQPGSSANVFNKAVMEELSDVVDLVASESGVRGVVFWSAKPSIFIAGADVREFTELADESGVLALVERGQRVFQKIADLPIPTVAAIHGACLGGGCELALACKARIASDDPATRIGLPETMLGIIPAWGGSTRLPRLVGLPAALGAILAGDRMAPRKAKKIGLVDAVVPKEHLLRVARQMILGAMPARPSHGTTNNAFVRGFIRGRARRQTLAKTGGHYPAPLIALDVAVRGLGTSVEKSLELERRAAVTLMRSPVAANLVRIFLLQERAKKIRVLPADAPEPAAIGPMAVIGAGIMGAGIAQWSAARGHRVILKDINHEALAKGVQTIAKLFKQAADRHRMDRSEARRAMDRIAPATGDVPLPVDLVIEAAAEVLSVKQAIFADLEQASRPDTILATNTSSLPVADIAARTRHPERVVGIHFFNPVHKMQLVEVIVGPRTAPEVADRAVRWVQSIGKLPVVCKDSPGFLVNRILLPYLIEAGLLFADGASVTELDAAMTAFGMPMGPMRLLDEVGLDVAWHAANGMSSAFADRIPVPIAIRDVTEMGFLGRKNRQGFYLYGDGRGKPVVNEAVARLGRQGGPASRLARTDLAERMVLPMLNEAARVLEEGVVAAPEDVDLGMILGTGFAPFRGGPLRYADELGAAHVVTRLENLAATVGERYRPSELLREMARQNRTFYGSDSQRFREARSEAPRAEVKTM